MTAFRRPGRGWRLFPEPHYEISKLAEADSPEEFLEVYRELREEGREVLQRIDALDSELRETAREERRVALELRDHRQQQALPPHRRLYPRSADIDDQIQKLSTELDELVKLENELQDERKKLVTFLDRNYVVLRVERDQPDLSPPDLEEERDSVGEPVDAWWTPR